MRLCVAALFAIFGTCWSQTLTGSVGSTTDNMIIGGPIRTAEFNEAQITRMIDGMRLGLHYDYQGQEVPATSPNRLTIDQLNELLRQVHQGAMGGTAGATMGGAGGMTMGGTGTGGVTVEFTEAQIRRMIEGSQAGMYYNYQGQEVPATHPQVLSLAQLNQLLSQIIGRGPIRTAEFNEAQITAMIAGMAAGRFYNYQGHEVTATATQRLTLAQLNQLLNQIRALGPIRTAEFNEAQITAMIAGMAAGRFYNYQGQEVTATATQRLTLAQLNQLLNQIRAQGPMRTAEFNEAQINAMIAGMGAGKFYNYQGQEVAAAFPQKLTLAQLNELLNQIRAKGPMRTAEFTEAEINAMLAGMGAGKFYNYQGLEVPASEPQKLTLDQLNELLRQLMAKGPMKTAEFTLADVNRMIVGMHQGFFYDYMGNQVPESSSMKLNLAQLNQLLAQLSQTAPANFADMTEADIKKMKEGLQNDQVFDVQGMDLNQLNQLLNNITSTGPMMTAEFTEAQIQAMLDGMRTGLFYDFNGNQVDATFAPKLTEAQLNELLQRLRTQGPMTTAEFTEAQIQAMLDGMRTGLFYDFNGNQVDATFAPKLTEAQLNELLQRLRSQGAGEVVFTLADVQRMLDGMNNRQLSYNYQGDIAQPGERTLTIEQLNQFLQQLSQTGVVETAEFTLDDVRRMIAGTRDGIRFNYQGQVAQPNEQALTLDQLNQLFEQLQPPTVPDQPVGTVPAAVENVLDMLPGDRASAAVDTGISNVPSGTPIGLGAAGIVDSGSPINPDSASTVDVGTVTDTGGPSAGTPVGAVGIGAEGAPIAPDTTATGTIDLGSPVGGAGATDGTGTPSGGVDVGPEGAPIDMGTVPDTGVSIDITGTGATVDIGTSSGGVDTGAVDAPIVIGAGPDAGVSGTTDLGGSPVGDAGATVDIGSPSGSDGTGASSAITVDQPIAVSIEDPAAATSILDNILSGGPATGPDANNVVDLNPVAAGDQGAAAGAGVAGGPTVSGVVRGPIGGGVAGPTASGVIGGPTASGVVGGPSGGGVAGPTVSGDAGASGSVVVGGPTGSGVVGGPIGGGVAGPTASGVEGGPSGGVVAGPTVSGVAGASGSVVVGGPTGSGVVGGPIGGGVAGPTASGVVGGPSGGVVAGPTGSGVAGPSSGIGGQTGPVASGVALDSVVFGEPTSGGAGSAGIIGGQGGRGIIGGQGGQGVIRGQGGQGIIGGQGGAGVIGGRGGAGPQGTGTGVGVRGWGTIDFNTNNIDAIDTTNFFTDSQRQPDGLMDPVDGGLFRDDGSFLGVMGEEWKRARVDPAVCRKGQCTGPICYLPYEKNCKNYIVCQRTATGMYVAWKMRCAFGSYWRGSAWTCERVEDLLSVGFNCPNDPCRDGTLRMYADEDKNNCRTYWQCVGGVSKPVCCPAGSRFDRNLAECVQDFQETCRAPCPLKIEGCSVPGQKTASFYDGNCKTYWDCENGHPHPVCCKNGWYFNVNRMDCDLDTAGICKDTCPAEYKSTADGGQRCGVKFGNNTVTSYYLADGNCRSFMQCNVEGGYHEKFCCKQKHKYDVRQSKCVPIEDPLDPCSEEVCPTGYKEECRFTPVPGFPNKFQDRSINIEFDCAPGTYFDEPICTCNGHKAVEICNERETWVKFDHPEDVWTIKNHGGSGSVSPFGNLKKNVTSEGITFGTFDGASGLTVWPYTQTMFPTVNMRVNFQPVSGGAAGGGRQVLVSNCKSSSGSKPSFVVTLDPDRGLVEFRGVTNNEEAVLTVPYNKQAWNQLSVLFDGNNVLLMNEDAAGLKETYTVSARLTGAILASEKTLRFGPCTEDTPVDNGFTGFMSEVTFSKCLNKRGREFLESTLASMPANQPGVP